MANEQGPRWRFDSTGACRGLARDNVVVVGRTVNGGLLWPSIDLQREILAALNNHKRLLKMVERCYGIVATVAHDNVTKVVIESAEYLLPELGEAITAAEANDGK